MSKQITRRQFGKGVAYGVAAAAVTAAPKAMRPAAATARATLIDAASPPYNVSASASAARNGAALRHALADLKAAGGGQLSLPVGTIRVDQGGRFWCLALPSAAQIVGQGRSSTCLKVADGTPSDSVKMFNAADNTAVTDLRIAHLTIDCNRAHRPAVGEHSHGMQLGGARTPATRVLIEDVEIKNCLGDSLAMAGYVDQVQIQNCWFHDNSRAGLTFDPGGIVSNVLVTNSRFEGSQNALAIEPNDRNSGVRDVRFLNCNFVCLEPSSYCVTLGSDAYEGGPTWTENINLRDCTINGPVSIVGTRNVRIEGSTVVCGDTRDKAAFMVRYRNQDVTVSRCTIRHAGSPTTQNVNAAFFVVGPIMKGVAYQPTRITIENNRLVLFHSTNGIVDMGALDMIVRDNEIRWDDNAPVGPRRGAAIFCRATAPIQSLIVANNVIRNPRGAGIKCVGNPSDYKISHAFLIDRNTILDSQPVHTLTQGIAIQNPAALIAPGCVYRDDSNNVVVSSKVGTPTR